MLHKLILGVVGIYGAYLIMSYLSETLYNTDYKSFDPELPPARFTYPPLMVWLGCFLCSMAGFLISAIKKEKPNPISMKERIIMGGIFTINMVTTNTALLYISYPVQVIGRNIRFLFVVIVGAFFSRLRKNSSLKLGKHKIFIASVITIGVLLFNFAKESKKDKMDRHDPNLEQIGYLMLGISVIADAFFSDCQAYSKVTFKPSANHLFTITNFFSFIICISYSIFVDRSFVDSIKFILNYPQALINILSIGVLQVIGQISIYYIVANFKQHIFPLISTTRKILTVILSIFIFNHHINTFQWIAIGIVFVGMFYQFYEELKHVKRKDDRQLKGAQQNDNSSSDDSEQTDKKKEQADKKK